MFDKFQDDYFSKNPEKWKEVEKNMQMESQDREKKMLEYRAEMEKKLETDDQTMRNFGDDDNNKDDL